MKKLMQLYEETRKPENQNISGLKGQIVQLGHDYQGMLRAREESRKQMDAKFLDIHRKIQGNQEFADAEVRRVGNTLEAFGSKFNNKMAAVKKNVEGQINEHKTEAEHNRSEMFKRLDKIKRMIEQEREDRIRQASQVFGAIKAHLKEINDFYETEKADRIDGEKGMLRFLDDNNFQTREGLDNAKTDHSRGAVKMTDLMKGDLKRQHKSNQAFQNKAVETFNQIRKNLEDEMEDRFDKQDDINDNLSNYLKTYQETLRIIGESS